MNKRRRMTGVVKSNKMMKTIVVETSRTFRHPVYKKVIHTTNRFKAHDELGCQPGDQVKIVETRPLSHSKRWAVEVILKRKGQAEEENIIEEVVDESLEPQEEEGA